MRELTKEELMTTKELAAQLGCSVDTITNACKRIFPAKMVKGKKTFFNESEITIMIDELKKNKSVRKDFRSDFGSYQKHNNFSYSCNENKTSYAFDGRRL